MDSVPADMAATQFEREAAETQLLNKVQHVIQETSGQVGQIIMKGSHIVLPQTNRKEPCS